MTDSIKSSTVELYCPIEQTLTITEEKLKEMADAEGGTATKFHNEAIEVSTIPDIVHFTGLKRRTINHRKFFSLFLYVKPKDGINKYRIHGKYSFMIKSANYFSQFDFVFNEDIQYWGDDICQIEEFFNPKRKLIVDGKVTIQMKGFLIAEMKEMPKILPELGPLSQGLWERDDKDFKVVVGSEGKVMVHKIVLATRSSVFNAMFYSKLEEYKTNVLKIIDFNLATVSSAIEFFYDRDIFNSLNISDAFELLRFADKYNIADLKNKLDTYLSYQLSPTTVCQITNASVKADYTSVTEICADFLLICLRHSIPVKEIDILDKEFAAKLFQKAFSPLTV